MKKVSILGCCVLRDAFRVANNPNYQVVNFYQFVSPISIIGSPSSFKLNQESLSDFAWTNFVKKCVCSDFNKNIPDAYREKPSDYLIIDLCEMRFQIMKVSLPNGETFFLTKHRYTEELIKNTSKFAELKDAKFEDYPLNDEERIQFLDKYMKLLTELYPEEKIILVKNKPYHKYVDENEKEVKSFNVASCATLKKRLELLYQHVANKFPQINCIDIPDNAICYAQHIWGIDPLHFYDEYYNYLFKAIDIICTNAQNKEERIEEIRKAYSLYFAELEYHKHARFIAERGRLGNNLVTDPSLTELNSWNLSLASKSNYDRDKHLLSCSESANTWAILSQPIDISRLTGQPLVLSVKFQTFNQSTLNLCIRYTKSDGSYAFPLFTKCISEEKITVSFVKGIIDNIDASISDAKIMVYLTEPNASAKIEEVKLEFGNYTTLL